MADENRGTTSEDRPVTDSRLTPGGAHPAPGDPGMSSLDRTITPSGAQSTGQEDYGQPPDSTSELRDVYKK